MIMAPAVPRPLLRGPAGGPRRAWAYLLVAAVAVASGCGKPTVPRYGLSGTLSYEGKPVPAGWIIFVPERGPGATAGIVEGRFATRAGWGTIGGRHRLEIEGLAVDGAGNPQPLFRHECELDLPRESKVLELTFTKGDLVVQGVSDDIAR